MKVSPGGEFVCVTHVSDSQVTLIDTATQTVIGTFPVPYPYDVDFLPIH